MESQTQPMTEEFVRRFNPKGIVFGNASESDEWPVDISTPTMHSTGYYFIQSEDTQVDKTEGFPGYRTQPIDLNVFQDTRGNLLHRESVDPHQPDTQVLMHSPLSIATAKLSNSGMFVVDANQTKQQQAMRILKLHGYSAEPEEYRQPVFAPERFFSDFWLVPKGGMKYIPAIIAVYSPENKEEEISSTRGISRQLVHDALIFSGSYLEEGFEREFNYLLPLFSFRNQEKVKSFLIKHPFLVRVLKDAEPEIRRFFAHVQIFLEVESDPEDTTIVQLGCIIMSDLSPQNSYVQLQEFEECWWLGNLERAKGILLINVEFK